MRKCDDNVSVYCQLLVKKKLVDFQIFYFDKYSEQIYLLLIEEEVLFVFFLSITERICQMIRRRNAFTQLSFAWLGVTKVGRSIRIELSNHSYTTAAPGSTYFLLEKWTPLTNFINSTFKHSTLLHDKRKLSRNVGIVD